MALAAMLTPTATGSGATTSPAGTKTSSAVDLIDRSQQGFSQLRADSEKAEQTKKETSNAKNDEAHLSDRKRFDHVYAAYAGYSADDTQSKSASTDTDSGHPGAIALKPSGQGVGAAAR